ncbi:MAG: DUF1549 domain-containing protein [Isosphaeraceae bacterium]|nr:DUF1549 domain-containing protein [Isosphaeraceae bacterium]
MSSWFPKLALLVAGVMVGSELLPVASGAAPDFARDVEPILRSSCLSCHSRGKYKGGLSLESRQAMLEGGEGGPAIRAGHAGESLLIQLIEGREPERRMPAKGKPLGPEQVAVLRAWIDSGAEWPLSRDFGFPKAPLSPRLPTIPERDPLVDSDHPIDRFIASHSRRTGLAVDWTAVDDSTFLRRASLDLVGLLPTPEQLSEFQADRSGSRFEKLVDRLLSDRQAYADHWMTYWNDLLRNAYKGPGFIDNGRKTITEWLYRSLLENKRYDQFVRELIQPVPGSEGFTKGIVWRGVVNASQTPAVQAAQNLSQVFLATNLKCASCHDSFVNRWKLTDAYSLAAVFADGPLEISRCDKPTGVTAEVAFIFPELGSIDRSLKKSERLQRLADLLVRPENGRFSRAIVNRLWAQLMGRGLVEPLDDLDQPPWSSDLLDWLASDFVAHDYDIVHTLRLIATSRTYRMASVDIAERVAEGDFEFRGPARKRMTAEQFSDAISSITGDWDPATSGMIQVDGRGQGGQLSAARAAIAAVMRPASGESIKLPDLERKWIWSHEQASSDRGGTIFLRRKFRVEVLPDQFHVVATCDNEFALYVNGVKVLESVDWKKPVAADVRSLLRIGENVIAVSATNWPDRENRRGIDAVGPNPAGFLAAAIGLDRGISTHWFGSDESWKVSTQPAPRGRKWLLPEFDDSKWKAAVVIEDGHRRYGPVDLGSAIAHAQSVSRSLESVRAVFAFDDSLLTNLGRPLREQVVTRRDSLATTLQALELTNGATLNAKLERGSAALIASIPNDPSGLADRIFQRGFGRRPTKDEESIAQGILGERPTVQQVQDLLWCLVMQPEFQIIR